MSVPVMCALVPELTSAGCRMCGFGGLGFREGDGEGAERDLCAAAAIVCGVELGARCWQQRC